MDPRWDEKIFHDGESRSRSGCKGIAPHCVHRLAQKPRDTAVDGSLVRSLLYDDDT